MQSFKEFTMDLELPDELVEELVEMVNDVDEAVNVTALVKQKFSELKNKKQFKLALKMFAQNVKSMDKGKALRKAAAETNLGARELQNFLMSTGVRI